MYRIIAVGRTCSVVLYPEPCSNPFSWRSFMKPLIRAWMWVSIAIGQVALDLEELIELDLEEFFHLRAK